MTSRSDETAWQQTSPSSRRHGQEKYQCPRCPSSFKRPEHLKRHQRGHDGQRKFACATCSKRFGRSDILSRHEAMHLAIESGSGSTSGRKRACAECAKARERCSRNQPCLRCVNKSLSCVYPEEPPPKTPMIPNSPPPRPVEGLSYGPWDFHESLSRPFSGPSSSSSRNTNVNNTSIGIERPSSGGDHLIAGSERSREPTDMSTSASLLHSDIDQRIEYSTLPERPPYLSGSLASETSTEDWAQGNHRPPGAPMIQLPNIQLEQRDRPILGQVPRSPNQYPSLSGDNSLYSLARSGDRHGTAQDGWTTQSILDQLRSLSAFPRPQDSAPTTRAEGMSSSALIMSTSLDSLQPTGVVPLTHRDVPATTIHDQGQRGNDVSYHFHPVTLENILQDQSFLNSISTLRGSSTIGIGQDQFTSITQDPQARAINLKDYEVLASHFKDNRLDHDGASPRSDVSETQRHELLIKYYFEHFKRHTAHKYGEPSNIGGI